MDATIPSILAQTTPDFELIIGDDASPGGTEEVCWRWAASDSRMRYQRRPDNIVIPQGFNLSTPASTGNTYLFSALSNRNTASLRDTPMQKRYHRRRLKAADFWKKYYLVRKGYLLRRACFGKWYALREFIYGHARCVVGILLLDDSKFYRIQIKHL